MTEVKELTKDEALRLRSVELAIQLTLKDEALFAGGMLEYADRINNFIKSGEVNKTALRG
jgi:uncharacterized protein YjbK